MKLSNVLIKHRHFLSAAFLIAVTLLSSIIYFGFIEPKDVDQKVLAYEKEISGLEVPVLDLEIDEEGKYDKKALHVHEGVLVALAKEFRTLEKEISATDLIPTFIRSAKKEGLLELTQSKLDEVSDALKSVSSFEKAAEEKAVAHAAELEKQRLEAEAVAKAVEEAKKAEEKKKLEEEKKLAEAEAKKKELSVVQAPSGGTSTKTPVSSTTPKTSTTTGTGTKTGESTTVTQPKPELKPEPVKEPQPAYGSISRQNMNVSDYWQWEHGQFYYIWSEMNTWSTFIQPGSTVTNRDRWVNHLKNAFPEPTRNGTSVGEKVGAGTIWVYFGGKF